LHVTVFDTVVHHLDIVASTLVTDPLAAGLAITLRSNALEDIFDVWPGLFITAGHQRRAISGTFFTPGNSGTYESDTLASQVFCSSVGVREMRVTTIDNDIAFLNMGKESLDEVVDWLSGHDEEHHPAGFLELADELLDRVSALN
jgi:hypothetical protein